MSKRIVQPPEECRFYRAKDLARIFGVCERTVWQWSATDLLPEPMRMPNWTGWPKEQIDELIKAGNVPSRKVG